jgi:DNA 3'-phosphatase
MWKSLPGCFYYESTDFLKLSYLTTRDIKGPKFALFDLDKTLITPKNGKNPYSLHLDEDPYNYTYLCDKSDLVSLLQSLKRQKYVISIMTNQSRLNDNIKNRIETFRQDLTDELGWSPFIFIGTKDKYLKPNTGSFKLLCKLLNFIYTDLDVEKLRKIENGLPNFFMVGDASGKDDTFPPYRYASTDKDFAKNLSLLLSKTYTVCQYIRPIDIFGSHVVAPRDYQELVITVGNPGSGKSAGSYNLKQAGYKICISDVIRDRVKLAQCVNENLTQGSSVVVDAMNPYKEKREDYISIARKLKIPVRILWFVRDGRPFNYLRGTYDANLGGYKTSSVYYHKEPVPDVAYNTYTKQFEEPNDEEGEIEIVF